MSRIVTTVIERHADDAAFLWEQRERAAVSLLHDRVSLSELDERLAAHLDGLALAGAEGAKVCEALLERIAALRSHPAGELFSAARLAAELGDTLSLARHVVLSQRRPGLRPALISALAWLRAPAARRVLSELVAEGAPAVLLDLGIGGHAVRCQDPGPALERALHCDDAAVRARACAAAGRLGRRDASRLLRQLLTDGDAEVRRCAATAAALLGDRSALAALWEIAGAAGEGAPAAADLAARRADPSESAERLSALATSEATLAAALSVAAARGDPVNVPWILDVAGRWPALAGVAGVAYASITGVKIEPPLFAMDRRGKGEAPGSAAVLVSAPADVHPPVPDELRAHWSGVRRRFREGERYLGGRPISREWLHECLRDGPQPWRAAAALELSGSVPGPFLFPVTAPSKLQELIAAALSV